MRVASLAAETDFAGWRDAARRLRAEGVAPEDVLWTVDGDLFPPPGPDPVTPAADVPAPASEPTVSKT